MDFTTIWRAGGSVLLLAGSLVAHGQEAGAPAPAGKGTYLGFRAGYSNYRMTGSEADFRTTPYRVQYSQGSVTVSDENLPVQGFTVGGVLRQRIFRPLSVQVEADYVREGGRFQNGVGGSGYVIDRGSYTLDCLQLPVLLNLTLLPIGPVALHIEGGAALNLALSGVKLDTPNLHPDNKFDNPEAIFATAYGAELTWKHDNRIYLLNFRHTNDLADFYQREYLGTHYNLHSSGFSITTGILFGRP